MHRAIVFVVAPVGAGFANDRSVQLITIFNRKSQIENRKWKILQLAWFADRRQLIEIFF